MSQNELKRLNEILFSKWTSITDSLPYPSPGHQVIYAHFKWRDICDSVGIKKTHLPSDYFAHPGKVTEEAVFVSNPAIYSAWLEMTHETADMILTLGLP